MREVIKEKVFDTEQILIIESEYANVFYEFNKYRVEWNEFNRCNISIYNNNEYVKVFGCKFENTEIDLRCYDGYNHKIEVVQHIKINEEV